MKKIITCLCLALVGGILAQAQNTPIYGGRLQTDLDAGGNMITNLPSNFLREIGAGTMAAENVAGFSSPGWRVWQVGSTNYFARSQDGASTYTNGSFSRLMGTVITNAGIASVIEFGAGKFWLDEQINVSKLLTFRGQGNYGTTIAVTNGYEGKIITVGQDDSLGGIVYFTGIRFNGNTVNTNVGLHFQRVVEVKIEDCEMTGFVGPSVRIEATQATKHWNHIMRSWFVGNRNTSPVIDLVQDDSEGKAFRDLLISGCHFGIFGGTSPVVRTAGNVQAVQFVGNRVWKDPATAAFHGLQFTGGKGHVVSGNSFGNWTVDKIPIQFTSITSNDFGSLVSGNVFHDSTTTNAVWVGPNAYGVQVYGNELRGAGVTLLNTIGPMHSYGGYVGTIDYGSITNPPALGALAYSNSVPLALVDGAGSMAVEDKDDYQSIGAQTITYAGTNVYWDVSVYSSAAVTLTNNARLSAATGIKAGARYTLRVTQDTTGSRLLTYDGAYLATGGIAPTLTSTTNRTDLLIFEGISTTNMMRAGFFPDVR